MKTFNHVNARTVAEAAAALADGKSALIAGGTDLIGRLKDDILPTYPETVVNLKTVPGLDYIKEEGGVLKIGAGAHLVDIAQHPVVNQKYTALAQSAARAGSPYIRQMGTIGGNINQLHRCWYFRTPENRFNCIRKGGPTCFALEGDNRYHSIFGASSLGCIAVHPGDTAPALIALDARIVTDRRTIAAQDFWDARVPGSTVLAVNEIVTEIQIPAPVSGARSAFLKFAVRKSIDFPVVNCAVLAGGGAARIVLNAVAPTPYRATAAEELIAGRPVDEANADAAASAAVTAAVPLPANKYKVQIARTLVKRALLATAV